MYSGQILDGIFTYQTAVTHNSDLVTHFIYLIQEMGYEDDTHASGLQIAHQAEELCHFLLIQRGGRLIQDQYFTIHIYSSGNGYHLLHGDGTACQLLGRFRGDIQIL